MLKLICPLLLVVLPASVPTAASATPPNILLIYSDDHGWADLGAQGVDGDIRTPNLDALVREGVRFARGYVSAPQCVPSRAGVITGRYQQKFGVEDNNKGPLPLSEITIAERLKSAGYLTGQVGKWHLDITGDKKSGSKADRIVKENMPNGQGFDEYWRGEMKQYYASHDLKGKPFADAPHLVNDERFRVDVQTEAALAFLDRRAAKPGQPWFLYLAWFAPHIPLESPEPWFSKTPENLPLERRQALAMIAAMDDGLGRIRAKLKEMGEEKNTLIFFIGDNGAPLGKVWDGSINLPMIGQKGMLSEGGIRTPFVAAWPGKIPAGMIYDHPVINLDVAATAVALAGLPHDDKLDGVNLMPFLTGESKSAPHDFLFWRWGSQAAVLEFPYKLILLGDRAKLLFDVTTPEGENIEKNLISQKPEVAARLEAHLKEWTDTLQPPGLPTSLDPHHEGLFEEHDLIPKSGGGAERPGKGGKAEKEGCVRGWICRNGTIAIANGALTVTPESPDAKAFLSCTNLDFAGPVTVTLRLRAQHGGKGSIAWRTKEIPDFAPENAADFDLPTAADWREVKAALPVNGSLIHLRVTPPKGTDGLEIQRIEIAGKTGKPQIWDFSQGQ